MRPRRRSIAVDLPSVPIGPDRDTSRTDDRAKVVPSARGGNVIATARSDAGKKLRRAGGLGGSPIGSGRVRRALVFVQFLLRDEFLTTDWTTKLPRVHSLSAMHAPCRRAIAGPPPRCHPND